MKTTVEIRVDLLRRAESLALARGIPLEQLLSEALDEHLSRHRSSSAAQHDGGTLGARSSGSRAASSLLASPCDTCGDHTLLPAHTRRRER